MTRELGLDSQTFTVAFRGPINLFQIRNMVEQVIEAIGMTKIFKPTIYEWPDDIGFIYVQPLYESMVSVDAWPRHNGGYMWVCSCKPFDTQVVLRVLQDCAYASAACEMVEMAL